MGSTGVRAPDAADDLVIRTIQQHADGLLKHARRHSLCADDAYDAYQRGLELFLHHADRLDEDRAHQWLFTVVKREAWAVREQRQRLVGSEEVDLDALEAAHEPSPEDSALAFESVARAAEALQRLKPQEVQALWLRASGLSYAEIAEGCSWSYTKVNRCLAEGRRSLLERYSEIESGEECERWGPLLSAMVDGEASATDLADLRPHLRNCPSCRATVRALHEAGGPLGLVLPATLVVTAAGQDHADGAVGLLVRSYEALAGGVHERVAMSALKLQAAADALSAGKIAAVAASAAAIAGGGVVVSDRTAPSRPSKPSAARAADAPGARTRQPRLAAAVTRAPLAAVIAPKKITTATRSPDPPERRKTRKDRAAARRVAKRKAASAAATAAATEFSLDAITTRRRGPATARTTPHATAAASTPSTTKPPSAKSSAQAAQQEFSP